MTEWPEVITRSRFLRCLCVHMRPADALEVEHACSCVGAATHHSYRRMAMTLLHGLENAHSDVMDIVQTQGGLAAFTSTAVQLYGRNEVQERVDSQENEEIYGDKLLTDLVHSEQLSFPDAGIRCQKCRSSNVSFEFLQTRAADEGTTIFCTCCVCGKRWKM